MIKSPQEIEVLKQGGKILSDILREVRAACVPGASTEALDALARKRMEEIGGTPSFLGYRNSPRDPAFPGGLCISINEEVVHGLPIPDRTIQKGDVVGLDIGMWYQGLATDMATTVIAGGTDDDKIKALVAATRESLVQGISVIKAGGMVGDIGIAVENYLKPKGYGIVKDLVGHGVGHKVHEEPQVPNFRDRRAPRVPLQVGMVLAIEPMITLGGWEVYQKDDGWTIVTADGSLSAHFEVTIAVTETGYDLVTPWPDEGRK